MRMLGWAALALLAISTAAKATCSISATPTAFGTYVPTATSNSTGTVTVSRAAGTADCDYSIALSQGSSGTYSPRYMSSGGSNLSYQLYLDSGRTVVWSDTARVGSPVPASGQPIVPDGGSVSHPVYGRVFSGQFLTPGTYTDTIIATVAVTSGSFSNTTTMFNVTTTVQATCSISATNLAFGNYAGTVLNANATITVRCTNTTSYNVGLDAGTATGATVTTRKMKSGANLLNYALFSDSGRTTNWGILPAAGVPGTGSGNALALTVYGQVPAGQFVTPGVYADAIIATITY